MRQATNLIGIWSVFKTHRSRTVKFEIKMTRALKILLPVLTIFCVYTQPGRAKNDGGGAGVQKCPAPGSEKELFKSKEFPIQSELKSLIDADADIKLSMISYEVFKSVSNKGALKNTDRLSWCTTFPLCDVTIMNYTFFYGQIYGPLNKCGSRFCSDTRAGIRAANLCPNDSDNIAIIPGYTRCIKVLYPIKFQNRTVPDNYQDVCVCAYCDKKNNDAFYYLFYENPENPGVYLYKRVDSSPYSWPNNPNYKKSLTNELNKSQTVTLEYFSFDEKSKYEDVFTVPQAFSDCHGGAVKTMRLPDYTDAPPAFAGKTI